MNGGPGSTPELLLKVISVPSHSQMSKQHRATQSRPMLPLVQYWVKKSGGGKKKTHKAAAAAVKVAVRSSAARQGKQKIFHLFLLQG